MLTGPSADTKRMGLLQGQGAGEVGTKRPSSATPEYPPVQLRRLLPRLERRGCVR